MDPNYILIWIVGISTGLTLLRWTHLQRLRQQVWLAVSAFTLVVLIAGLLLAPTIAGYLAGLVWLVFLVLPLAGNRQLLKLWEADRYRAAAWLSRALSVLHPSTAWRQRHRQLLALERLQAGDFERGRELLRERADQPGGMGRLARLQLLALDWRWDELIATIDGLEERERALQTEPSTIAFYLRALGEQGRLDEIVQVYQTVSDYALAAMGAGNRHLIELFVLAFAGRSQGVDALLTGPLRGYRTHLHDYWRAVALQAGDRRDEARALLEPLRPATDKQTARAVAHRLEHPLAPVDPSVLSPATRTALVGLVEMAAQARSASTAAAAAPPRRAWVTAAVLVTLTAVFLIEIPGGATDAANLISMGALKGPPQYLEGEYWRVLTAGLLHFGATHLVLNLFGVWYFGRLLERMVGAIPFLIIYVVSGVGALGAILGWTAYTGAEPFLLVGASASLMGVVGASAAQLLRMWARRPSRAVRQQLRMLAFIIALQTVFDLVTPQVSFAAHFGGLVIGLALGAVLTGPASRVSAGLRAPRADRDTS